MSVEARLQALIQNYRAQHGDAGLRAAPQLIAQLSSQAPDLYGEIRALAAVLAGNGAARIAAAPDKDAEAQRVATEIAGSEKLSMAVAIAGVAVARALGPLGGAAPAAPAAPPAAVGGWAGETMVAPGSPPAASAPPPQQPYAPPGQPQPGGYVPPGSMPGPGGSGNKHLIIIGAVAAAVLVGGYLYTQRDKGPAPAPPAPLSNEQGPVAGGPQGGGPQGGSGGAPQEGGQPPQQSGGYPTLASSAPGPALQVNRMQNGYAIPFLIQVDGTPTPGGVIVPLNGWDGGPATIVFGQPGDTNGTGQIVNTGSARLERAQGQNGPSRMGQVQWQRDQLNIGPICIAFNGNGQSQSGDVGMSRTTMCLMDQSCQQILGCGTIR